MCISADYDAVMYDFIAFTNMNFMTRYCLIVSIHWFGIHVFSLTIMQHIIEPIHQCQYLLALALLVIRKVRNKTITIISNHVR